MWWPKRALNKNDINHQRTHRHPIGDAEGEISFYRQEVDGVALYTRIGGYSGSSTRAELAAGIIAACADGPIHLASDSKVFVDGVNDLISKIKDGSDARI